jgi:hypothetical protein
MRIASDGAAFCLAALLFCLPLPVASAETPANALPAALKPVTVGRLTVAWSAPDGLTVSVDGVPVARGSSLVLREKDSSRVLLNQKRETPRVADWTDTADGERGARVTIDNDDAACVYDLIVGSSGGVDHVTVDLTYRRTRNAPTDIAYTSAYLSGPVLQGAAMTGPVGSPFALRVVPVAPPKPGSSNQLSPPFDEATLATRLGPMTISFRGDTALPVLIDARSVPTKGGETFPTFQLGVGSVARPVALATGQGHARFRFAFGPPAAPSRTADVAALEVTRSPLLPAASAPPLPGQPRVVTRPQHATYPAGAGFRLSPGTKIVPCDSTPGTRRAVDVLRASIKERAGFEPAVQLMASPHAIFVGVAGKSPFLDRRDLGAAARPEGCSVQCGGDAVLVSGFDEAGVLRGVQNTLLLVSSDGKGPRIRPARVTDWPAPRPVSGSRLSDGPNATRRGYTLRLAGADVRPASDWLGYGAEDSPTGLPTGDSRLSDGTIYNLGGGPLLLAGKLNPPGPCPLTAELPSLRGVDARPRTVRLLLAASHQATNGSRIGTLRVRTAGGKTDDVPLVYGRNVVAWSDPGAGGILPIAWKGATRSGQAVNLRCLEVSVVRGEVIDSVTVTSANTEAAPAVFGVTFLE